jgi:hypothetical protein
MKIKVLVLGLVFSLLICSGNIMAKERRGAEVVITKTDGQKIKGELIAVKASSLLLLDSRSATDLSVDVNGIRAIRIVRKPQFWLAGITFAIGAGLGYDAAKGDGLSSANSMVDGVLYGIALGIPTILLSGIDQTIQIEGKSPGEIKAIMEKLSRKARVTDFQ